MSIFNNSLFVLGSLLKKNPFVFNALLNYRAESLRIIYYHVVSNGENSFYFDNKAISQDEFEFQIKLFKKHYDIISLNEAIYLARDNKSLRGKLAITFDDGFMDNYKIAAPVLYNLNCKATFFLIGNCIDNKDLMWRNKLLLITKTEREVLQKSIKKVSQQYGLKESGSDNLMAWSFKNFPMDKKDAIVNELWDDTMNTTIKEYLHEHEPYMSTSQIIELKNQGFEFGSHSMSHPNFSKLSYEEFKKEIIDSKRMIEEILDEKVNTFTYPFGKRANSIFETKLLKEAPNSIDSFLGSRNRLKNLDTNIVSWERDNLEFPIEIALSRFFILSTLRNFLN